MSSVTETPTLSGIATLESRAPFSGPEASPVPDSAKIHYYARYFGDPLSRLFWHANQLCVGVLPPHGMETAKLLNSQLFADLFRQKLLVALDEQPIDIEGFEVAFRLNRTP